MVVHRLGSVHSQPMDTNLVKKAFSQTLRDARNAVGMSQERLAEKAGFHRNYISLLETGERQPSITSVIALSRALGISSAELVAKVEEQIEQAEIT